MRWLLSRIAAAALATAVLTPAPASASIRPTILAQLIHACAPTLPPRLYSAFVGLIEVESSAHAWAIDDDTGGGSYEPESSYDSAVSLAATVIARDAQRVGNANVRVDLGITQVDYMNFSRYGVTVADMMRPCTNIEIGARIFGGLFEQEDAALAARGVQDPTRYWLALDRTARAYNSGDPNSTLPKVVRYSRSLQDAVRGPFVAQTVAALDQRVGVFGARSQPTPIPSALFAGQDATPFANAHVAVKPTPAPAPTATPSLPSAAARRDDTQFAGNQ